MTYFYPVDVRHPAVLVLLGLTAVFDSVISSVHLSHLAKVTWVPFNWVSSHAFLFFLCCLNLQLRPNISSPSKCRWAINRSTFDVVFQYSRLVFQESEGKIVEILRTKIQHGLSCNVTVWSTLLHFGSPGMREKCHCLHYNFTFYPASYWHHTRIHTHTRPLLLNSNMSSSHHMEGTQCI